LNGLMKHDPRTIIKWISTTLLALGAFIGAVTLISTFRLARELPAGVCPYTSQSRSRLYLAIILCVAALVLSFFEDYNQKGK